MLCARDCSGVPRVKDAHGNYVCKACESASANAVEPDDIAIEPDRPTSRGVCPSCFRPLPPDTGVCVSCSTGLNRKPNPDGSGPTCQKCGYDLTGARSLICPECGTTQRPQAKKSLDMSHQVRRDAYLKPAIAMLAGIAAVTIFLASVGMVVSVPSILLAILIQSVVGLLIYWICSVVWIGFDEPFHINVMRLLAIYSISWFALLVTLSLPFLCAASIFLPTALFALLHKKMLDIDLADAAIVSVITGVVWLAVYVVVFGRIYL